MVKSSDPYEEIPDVTIMGIHHSWLEARGIFGYATWELKRLQKRSEEETDERLRNLIGLRFAKWNLWIIEYLLKDRS